MVLFFTGTGNSRYVASRIAETLQDELLCINDRIKNGDYSPIQTGGNVVIVTPTYAWRIPRIVDDWLLKTELIGAERVWFVMDCGGAIGNADKYNRILCKKKKLRSMGTAQIVMPENYIALFHTPKKEEAREIIQKAEPDILKAIQTIQESRSFTNQPNTLHNKFISGPVNPVFYTFVVKADAFRVNETCIGCGRCEKLCPMNNIRMVNGKPEWGKHCTHCMACICYCPEEAIEYGTRSIGKPRYCYEKLL